MKADLSLGKERVRVDDQGKEVPFPVWIEWRGSPEGSTATSLLLEAKTSIFPEENCKRSHCFQMISPSFQIFPHSFQIQGAPEGGVVHAAFAFRPLRACRFASACFCLSLISAMALLPSASGRNINGSSSQACFQPWCRVSGSWTGEQSLTTPVPLSNGTTSPQYLMARPGFLLDSRPSTKGAAGNVVNSLRRVKV